MEWHCALPWSSNWTTRCQYWIGIEKHGFTHRQRLKIGPNEVSIELAIAGMAVRTNWACISIETHSVSNQQRMEWHCAHPETSNWSKRGRYWIGIGQNGFTHPLRLQIGPNEISIELALDGMALRTNWDFKLVQTRSVLNWNRTE